MKKQNSKFSMSRLVIILIIIAVQIAWNVIIVWLLSQRYLPVSVVMKILELVIVLYLYWKRTNAAFKMPWMILILTFPVFGVLMYYMLGNPTVSKRLRRRFEAIQAELYGELKQDENVSLMLRSKDQRLANQSDYIWKYGNFPLYNNTDIKFFDDASKGLESQIEALKSAESFIFMEYHAFENAQAFKEVKEILYQKAGAGVDVRMIYDDMGSMSFIHKEFLAELKANNIKCRVFNPVIPIASPLINNRDHKKITVIDGRIGFTGGYNITDEYFNITHPYGQWKDSGLMLQGDAVRSLTVMFLETWNAIEREDITFEKFLPETGVKSNCEDFSESSAGRGFIQPFADTPLDDEPLGENVYMNILKSAVNYVYFMTPYLILSDEMQRELELAAKRGVDVRIITPGIPDKKIVYQGTRSFYDNLLEAGVRIYEYTPGFCHAKQCISDDIVSVVGTINLDYRSLYLHFENAVFFCGCSALADVKADFENTFPICREVHWHKHKFKTRLWRAILRLFAPMM